MRSRGLGVAFTVNIIKRIAGKLRRIILLHFGLVTCRFHYGRSRKLLIFMILGFSDVSMTPQNQYYLSLKAPTISKQIQEQYEVNSKNTIFSAFFLFSRFLLYISLFLLHHIINHILGNFLMYPYKILCILGTVRPNDRL